ncbi:MAG: bifunctional riboflavin kinase/FAD synthetase [Phreatobacter sp.]|nr:bifunctional riboflavin kinase/FAD synthetase [Phreatobacter sp.]
MPLILPPPRPPVSYPVIGRSGDIPGALRGCVVAIGNFDGVHRGHKHVLATARSIAASERRAVLALTFEPHPRSFFQPDVPLFRLGDAEAKVRLLAAEGIDGVALLAFDSALAAMSSGDFVDRILVDWLGAAHVVVGRDFNYGAKRSGDAATLAAAGHSRGFGVTQVEALSGPHGPISSSAIRTALAEGRVEVANDLLGHAWFVSAPVIHGEKRGRDLGYPTANLRLDPACALRHGIYAVRAGIDGRWHDAVASFGRRPTFDNGAPLLEVHVFDLAENLYDRIIDIAFASFLRPEERFDSLEALIAQMDEDSRRARDIFSRA